MGLLPALGKGISMKTKRRVGEKVRLLKSRHPAMRHDLINMAYGGKTGKIRAINSDGMVELVIKRTNFGKQVEPLVLFCPTKMLRGVT